MARMLNRFIYTLSKKDQFSKEWGLRDQIRRASGSVMHNIAEGFDAESNVEFMRFLRYAKRSCSEVQSQLYVSLDENYISTNEFEKAYELAGRARAAIRGFINYLNQVPSQMRVGEAIEQYATSIATPAPEPLNPEPRTQNL